MSKMNIFKHLYQCYRYRSKGDCGKSSPQMADGAEKLHSVPESQEKSGKSDEVATKRPRRRTKVELNS